MASSILYGVVMRKKFTLLFTIHWKHLLFAFVALSIFVCLCVLIFHKEKRYEIDMTSNKTGKRYIIKINSNGKYYVKEISTN